MTRRRAIGPDPQLESLELAWSTKRMRAFFAEDLVPRIWPGSRLEVLRRLYIAYKPGRHCMSSYVVELCGASASELVTLTLAPSRRLERIHRLRYGSRHRAARGGAFVVDDVPCLVEVFPADWKMPGLAAAMSLSEVPLDPGSPGGERAPVEGVRVVRYRAHRCGVLKYDLGSARSGAIGKVYSKASLANEVRAKLASLREQGHARGLAIPAPLGNGTTADLVLMELLPGENLADLLDEAAEAEAASRAAELVGRAAEALGSFQGMTFESRRRRTGLGDVDALPARAAPIRLVAPELHREMADLIARLRRLVADVPDTEPTLIHGDFKPSQLLLHGDRVAVVDLDRACPGDPAIDVGNFCAALSKEAIFGKGIFGALVDEFLAAVDRGNNDARLVQAARVQLAVSLVRMGIRKFERDPRSYASKGRGWKGGRLLAEASRRIDELERGAPPAVRTGAEVP